MKLTASIDATVYSNKIAVFVRELKADQVLLLKEEMRLLLRDIIEKTPPTKSPKSDTVKTGSRQRGNTAIENDMSRLAAPMDWRNIEMPGLAKAVYKRNIPAINAIIKNIGGGWRGRKVLASVSEIESSHLRNRNNYGRIRGNKRQLAFLTDWSAYTRILKKRVGLARGGWARAAVAVGLKLPSWVMRHQAYAQGGYQQPYVGKLEIEAVNRSIKIPNYMQRHVIPAISARIRSLTSEAARLLRGGKSRRGSLAGTASGKAAE